MNFNSEDQELYKKAEHLIKRLEKTQKKLSVKETQKLFYKKIILIELQIAKKEFQAAKNLISDLKFENPDTSQIKILEDLEQEIPGHLEAKKPSLKQKKLGPVLYKKKLKREAKKPISLVEKFLKQRELLEIYKQDFINKTNEFKTKFFDPEHNVFLKFKEENPNEESPDKEAEVKSPQAIKSNFKIKNSDSKSKNSDFLDFHNLAFQSHFEPQKKSSYKLQQAGSSKK